MAVLTQSTGVPSKEYLVTLCKGDAIRFKYKSLLIDMACDAALRCPSGATTVTLSATVATTSSKILKRMNRMTPFHVMTILKPEKIYRYPTIHKKRIHN